MRTIPLALALGLALAAFPVLADPRDPFASTLDEDVTRCFERSPLERVPLAAITIQGVIASTASPRALVKLPDGTIHLVRVGAGLGPNFGRVAAIRAAGVEVIESFRDPITGKAIPQRTLLAVR